jgi:hypothetical protein
MLYRSTPPTPQPAKTAGKRRELLLYRRLMGRLWGPFFILGLLLLAAYFTNGLFLPAIDPPFTLIVLGGAILITAFSLFARFAHSMAYFKPYPDHLRLATPFLNLRISYRRIRSIRPSPVASIFPPNKISWSARNYLEPFLSDTAIIVQLYDYPLSRRLMRLFLPEEMFLPGGKGLVFIVKDWMTVSTELDSYLDSFRQSIRTAR